MKRDVLVTSLVKQKAGPEVGSGRRVKMRSGG